MQLDVDVRVRGMEAGQPRQQPAHCDAVRRAHGEDRALARLGRLRGGAPHLHQGLGDIAQVLVADGGEDDAAMLPDEQLAAQVFFQQPDLPADRRRGDAQLGGRLGDAAQPARYLERPHCIERRQTIHARSRVRLRKCKPS
ncbi:hypothetical protein L548_1573 [Bordetella pertussis H921]|nr:hypothetical protein L548_1573 [Bordetella pertussis H921]ETH83593.1 hypothetical protein L559_0830 [Bordetella pertussis STO1-CHOC-0017]